MAADETHDTASSETSAGGDAPLETVLQRDLDFSCVIGAGNDPESRGIDIVVRSVEVHMIECIKKLYPEFEQVSAVGNLCPLD